MSENGPLAMSPHIQNPPDLNFQSRKNPTNNPAAPTTAPRNRRNDFVSGKLESLGGGQSTKNASAMSMEPNTTKSFQRNSMSGMVLHPKTSVDRLSLAYVHR